nr:Os05g0184250 [Ipomoea batatas]GMC74469.1 Os05g0184250 [Ipomoea batatas]GME21557.1 Os05g0184250 [Ipomoea batatas]
MPKPNFLETSLRGSPVANLHIQTATLCLTGTASLNMVFSFATTELSSLQIISNVSFPIRNAFLNSSSGKSALTSNPTSRDSSSGDSLREGLCSRGLPYPILPAPPYLAPQATTARQKQKGIECLNCGLGFCNGNMEWGFEKTCEWCERGFAFSGSFEGR